MPLQRRLGCGNPTALAELQLAKPLDPTGGIDVLPPPSEWTERRRMD